MIENRWKILVHSLETDERNLYYWSVGMIEIASLCRNGEPDLASLPCGDGIKCRATLIVALRCLESLRRWRRRQSQVRNAPRAESVNLSTVATDEEGQRGIPNCRASYPSILRGKW